MLKVELKFSLSLPSNLEKNEYHEGGDALIWAFLWLTSCYYTRYTSACDVRFPSYIDSKKKNWLYIKMIWWCQMISHRKVITTVTLWFMPLIMLLINIFIMSFVMIWYIYVAIMHQNFFFILFLSSCCLPGLSNLNLLPVYFESCNFSLIFNYLLCLTQQDEN